MEEKRRLNPWIPILIIGLIAVFIWQQKENAKMQEKLVAETYQNNFNLLVSEMLNDAAVAENMGNLIINVWNNAIWEKTDSETDKFTMVNGKFVSDFNDALRNLFDDEEFSKNASTLSANQQQIKIDMKSMLTPPEGFENTFRALENMYNSYIAFTDIVLNCSGSLNSFSDEFSSADKKVLDAYNAAELYVK